MLDTALMNRKRGKRKLSNGQNGQSGQNGAQVDQRSEIRGEHRSTTSNFELRTVDSQEKAKAKAKAPSTEHQAKV